MGSKRPVKSAAAAADQAHDESDELAVARFRAIAAIALHIGVGDVVDNLVRGGLTYDDIVRDRAAIATTIIAVTAPARDGARGER